MATPKKVPSFKFQAPSHWLFLDPRSQDEVIVGVGGDKFRFSTYKRNNEFSLLEFIGKHAPHIDGVLLVPGPGGFSNVRTTTTVANSLGFALGIPVVAMKPRKGETPKQIFERGMLRAKHTKPGKIITPVYDKEPHITFPKK